MEQRERPQTISGLEAKKAELLRLRDDMRDQIKALESDIAAINTTIGLFNPDARFSKFRYSPGPLHGRGQTRRIILDIMREAGAPLSVRQISDAVMTARKLDPADAVKMGMLQRVRAALTAMREQGVVMDSQPEEKGASKLWRLVDRG